MARKKTSFRLNPQAKEEIANILEEGMNRFVQVCRNETVRALNRTQPVHRLRSGRLVGMDPSAVGEPPKRVTSKLYRSIVVKVKRTGTRIQGFIGSTDPKAARLEFGFVGQDRAGRTISQGPRPFLRLGIKRAQKQFRRIFGIRNKRRRVK